MVLTAKDIAGMIDLSCVRTISDKADIDEMVAAAKKYGFGQVSVLQCFIPYTKELLAGNSAINIVGNVSFPSGSDTTTIKVAQAKEMAAAGCDEIDMVMNIGKLRSGELAEVEADVKAVADVILPKTMKVIIEYSVLTPQEAKQACEICLNCGVTFVKTGSGWIGRGTTVEDVRFIKAIVGEKAKIKASGGIRDLATLVEMYKEGARRFGVNLRSGISIVEEARAFGSGITI